MEALSDEKLLELARPLALGALAGGFAHRATNDMFAVAGLAELLLEDVPEDWPGRRQLAQIHGSGRKLQRASRLLSDLRHPAGHTRANLADVSRHAIELLKLTRVAESVEFQERYPEPAPFEGQADLAVLALIHLIRNAEESLDRCGVITIETGLGDGYVHVRVSDDGTPIAAELIDTLFEPFVSSKPGHAGLGLASARAAVRSLGGEVILADRSANCFELRLPAAT